MIRYQSSIKWLLSILLLTVCCNVYAEGSFRDAVKNGKVNGELKVWYQTNDRSTGGHNFLDKENSIFDAGLNIGYTTSPWYGFGAGINFYAVDDLGANGNIANNSAHRIDASESVAWLGEAYISYKKSNTAIKAGRQNINSPLINSDDWAVFPNSFEALWLQNTDIKDTSITAAYITKERKIKGDTFEDFAGDNGSLMLGAENKSIPGLALKGYYYHIRSASNIDSFYFEASGKIKNINIAGQYLYFNPDGPGADSTNAAGFQISSKIGLFDLSGAYSRVGTGSMMAARFSDGGCKTPLYTQTISGDGDIAGATDTNSIKLTAGITPIEKFTVSLSYGYYDHGRASSASPGNESESIELTMKYTGWENITLFAAYVNSDHNGVGGWKG
ncbi:MAG: OprD family porin, partial [Deltaproteobacteria bacterium]|nr:OprD family porin [Deltaproteobacteria bacterium]